MSDSEVIDRMREHNKKRSSKGKRRERIEKDLSNGNESKHKVEPPVVAKNTFQKELFEGFKREASYHM